MQNRPFFAACFVFFGIVLGAIWIAPSYALIHEKIDQQAEKAEGQKSTETGDDIVNSAQEKRTADYTLALDWWTAGIVVVAFVQMIMFGVQLGFMRKGMGDTRDAALAAKDSADVAKSTLTNLERPWIFVDLKPGLLPSKIPDEFCDKEATFALLNYGRFPATIDEFACTLNIGLVPEVGIVRDEFHRVLAPNGELPGRAYLPPSGFDDVFTWNGAETYVIAQVPQAPGGQNCLPFSASNIEALGTANTKACSAGAGITRSVGGIAAPLNTTAKPRINPLTIPRI